MTSWLIVAATILRIRMSLNEKLRQFTIDLIKAEERLISLYNHKYLIIKDKEVINSYETEQEAYNHGVNTYNFGTFFIQHISDEKSSYKLIESGELIKWGETILGASQKFVPVD